MNPHRCQECGERVEVTARHARRIGSNLTGILCHLCRVRNGRPITATDADFRFWADRFEVKVPKGRTARATLAAGPLPRELAEIVAGLRP